jgi:cephalosporin hydroxylase
MNGDRDFARSLSDFLAFHTEQSADYLNDLINSFLRGAQGQRKPEPSAQSEILKRLEAEVESNNNVPTFLQNYLYENLTGGAWTSQATFIASRYLSRQSGERFITWQRRQQLVAELNGEPLRGTELGFRQMLYSQGATSVFRWCGVPCFKTSYDLALYAMIIDELRPGTIIELGSGTGGSALFFADLCTSMGLTTQVLSIDNMVAEVSDPRITFIRSDCAQWLAATAKNKPELPRPCLVIEDFHGDLAGFFVHIDSILEAEDYLVIEDSFAKQNRIAQVIANRPYLIDTKFTDFFGVNCTSAVNSIFVKDSAANAPRSRPKQERQRLREQDRAWRQKNKRDT